MFTQPNDSLVVCPFNKSHHILKSRIHYHLIKCKKNYPFCNKIICPYNATEYIDPDKYEKHLLECEMKRTIDVQKYAHEKMLKNKEHGDISNAPFHYPGLEEPDEDWSEGPKTSPITTRSKSTNTWNSLLTEQRTSTTQVKTATSDSSLTVNPKNIPSKGRGQLLKEYLDSMNKQCDGLYCTKTCCPKNTQLQGQGRGALLKTCLNQSANFKPLGRAGMLRLQCKNNQGFKNQGISVRDYSTNNLKQACDDEKFKDADSEDEK